MVILDFKINVIFYAHKYGLGITYKVSCDKEEENEAKAQHSTFPPPLQ